MDHPDTQNIKLPTALYGRISAWALGTAVACSSVLIYLAMEWTLYWVLWVATLFYVFIPVAAWAAWRRKWPVLGIAIGVLVSCAVSFAVWTR